MARAKNVRAWLFTWEGDHGKDDHVAMLLHPDTALSRVAMMAALLYTNALGSASERMAYAIDRDPASHPNRARLRTIFGHEMEGYFLCGDNPCLYARLVEQVTVVRQESGEEVLRWQELGA